MRISKVLEEDGHAKAEPAEPDAVFDGLSPEEFAAQFFGGGSVRERQEGLTKHEWLKGQFKTKSAATQYLHSDLGGARPPKVIAKHIAVKGLARFSQRRDKLRLMYPNYFSTFCARLRADSLYATLVKLLGLPTLLLDVPVRTAFRDSIRYHRRDA